MKTASIGIFDSGFGGLTVMRAVKDLLPKENIIYFGDTANIPYGNKSADTIIKYSTENTKFLLTLDIKLLIIACHTACTAAYEHICKLSHIPVVGMIQPSLNLLKSHPTMNDFVLLGTRQTVNSGVYQKMILSEIPNCNLTSIFCPLFVPLVEEGYTNHPISEIIVKEHLSSLKGKKNDAVLLGCTHYPLLANIIQKELGPSTILINPGTECAKNVKELLKKENLLNDNTTSPCYKFYVSDDPKRFKERGTQFLKHPITDVFSTKIESLQKKREKIEETCLNEFVKK